MDGVVKLQIAPLPGAAAVALADCQVTQTSLAAADACLKLLDHHPGLVFRARNLLLYLCSAVVCLCVPA
jgi:hypothetical protein